MSGDYVRNAEKRNIFSKVYTNWNREMFKVTEVFKIKSCNKVASDTISKYNQLKLVIDNNKFNQNITNIHLDEMFSSGLKEFKEINKKTISAVDEALIKTKKTIVQYIIAILLESKLVGNKEQAKLEMHYDFKQEDIMKDIGSYFTL